MHLKFEHNCPVCGGECEIVEYVKNKHYLVARIMCHDCGKYFDLKRVYDRSTPIFAEAFDYYELKREYDELKRLIKNIITLYELCDGNEYDCLLINKDVDKLKKHIEQLDL